MVNIYTNEDMYHYLIYLRDKCNDGINSNIKGIINSANIMFTTQNQDERIEFLGYLEKDVELVGRLIDKFSILTSLINKINNENPDDYLVGHA